MQIYTAESLTDALLTQNIVTPGGRIIVSQRYDNDSPVGWYFYNYDIRQSTTTILNEDYGVEKSYKYDEFGNTVESGSLLNEIAYTSAVSDSNTGLYYMNSRYYNPNTGRFLTQDSYKGNPYDPWTQHLYSYVGNNPVNMVDPTGHSYTYIQDGKLCTGYIDEYGDESMDYDWTVLNRPDIKPDPDPVYIPQGNASDYVDFDVDWNTLDYGFGGTIGTAGCALAALENILFEMGYTSGDIKSDFEAMIEFALEKNYRTGDNGTGIGFFVAYTQSLGLNAYITSDINIVTSEVINGNFATVHVTAGTDEIFTEGGHYMAIMSYNDSTGNFHVHNPNRKGVKAHYNGESDYSPSIIDDHTIKDEPYVIIKRP